MARIDPIERDELPEFADAFARTEQFMGFVPNSMPTMARVPGLLPAFQQLAATIFMNDLIPPDLVQLVAHVTSTAAGCRYCQAHTGHSAERLGVSEEKLAEVWSFETSAHFDDAERAALRIAVGAGAVPNAVTDADMAAARQHWSDDQLAAIVAVCSLFGYLNRWNDSLATDLEPSPTAFGDRVLSARGWDAGNHG